ncbi:MAG: hypothetical protein PHX01_04760, partial [Clostridia bacterium]|nr:hypothetical protein [Clostridia bacterium]
MAINKSVIGETFVRAGQITEEQLKLVQKKQETTGKRLEDVLQEEGLMTEEEIKQFLKRKFNIGFVDLAKQEIQTDTPLLISEELARKYTVIPFKKSSYRLLVAMADPYDVQAIEEITAATGLNVLPRQAKIKEITEKINCFYPGELSLDLVKDDEEIDSAKAEKIVELEARRLEEKAKKAEAEAERQAKLEKEARKKAEEEARRKAEAEARKKAEEARKKAEEAQRKAEEEAQKKAEAEAQRRAEEEVRKKAEEARKKAEEARRKAEEARKKAEEARRKAEEEAQKKAEAEAQRRAEEEARKKAEA